MALPFAGFLSNHVQAAFSLPESTAMSFNPQRLQLDTAFAHIDKGNYEAAAPVLRRFAEQGDIDAQYQLAFMLEHGLGVKTDLEGAVHWYAKAAEQGDLAAQFNLAECLEDGVGTAQNYVQAAFWYF